MVFIFHPALRVKRFKIWKSALQKRGRNGSTWLDNQNVQECPKPFLNMIGHERSNVYPFQNNFSVHKSSAIAPPLMTFGPFLPSILKPLYQKSFQMSQTGDNPIPNIDWLQLEHMLNEPK